MQNIFNSNKIYRTLCKRLSHSLLGEQKKYCFNQHAGHTHKKTKNTTQIMKKHLLIFLLLLCGFMTGTQVKAQNKLVINLNDGNTACFVLTERPKITFSGDSLCVVSPTTTIEIARIAVKNFTFEESEDYETSIDTPHNDVSITASENSITLKGLTDGETVTVYGIDGKVIAKATAVDGCCTIALDNLSSGIYLININTTTIKYLKK